MTDIESDLIRMSRGGECVRISDELKVLLFQHTLQNALRTEFYREHLQHVKHGLTSGLGPPSCQVDIADVPTVTREQLVAARASAQAARDEGIEEGFTKGTTGKPLVFVRGCRERAFISRLFSDESAILGQETGMALRERVLSFRNIMHGSHVRIPTRARLHTVSIYDSCLIDYCRDVIRREYAEPGVAPRCSVIVGAEPELRVLAEELEADAPYDKIKLVVSYGGLMSKAARQLHEKVWRSSIIADRYSLSEAFGGATSTDGRWWHFDPWIIPEVLSLSDRTRVLDGVGRLVITVLWPFQISQPLVRYETGDIVRCVCVSSGTFPMYMIRPLGRLRDSVVYRGRCLVAAATLMDVLGEYAEVSRRRIFLDAKGLHGQHDGDLSFSLFSAPENIRIRVPCRESSASRLRVLSSEMTDGVRAVSPELHRAMLQGLDFQIEAYDASSGIR